MDADRRHRRDGIPGGRELKQEREGIPDLHVIPNLALEAFTHVADAGPGRRSDVLAKITLACQYRER